MTDSERLEGICALWNDMPAHEKAAFLNTIDPNSNGANSLISLLVKAAIGEPPAIELLRRGLSPDPASAVHLRADLHPLVELVVKHAPSKPRGVQ